MSAALWSVENIARRHPNAVTPGVVRALNDVFENGPTRKVCWEAHAVLQRLNLSQIGAELPAAK